MTSTFTSRLASLSFASLMTLAMLLSVDTLATRDAPTHQQMASTATARLNG